MRTHETKTNYGDWQIITSNPRHEFREHEDVEEPKQMCRRKETPHRMKLAMLRPYKMSVQSTLCKNQNLSAGSDVKNVQPSFENEFVFQIRRNE